MGAVESLASFRHREFSDVTSFVHAVHEELSVRDVLVAMGYLQEEQFVKGKVSCVFHKEKTPSLQVADKFFKCYGCGVKGDLFKWVMEYDSLCFLESVEKVAEFLGSVIKETKFVSLKPLRQSIQKEWEYYVQCYKEVAKSKDEKSLAVLERGRQYFPLPVGYDPEINYVVLPFTNKQGAVLGFTKRAVSDSSTPKWRHSSLEESLIKECKNVFNLGSAYKEIKESKRAVVVEGPKDVASLLRAGVQDVVSSSGTSNFSKDVLDVLGQLESLVFMFDSDEAGRKAVLDAVIVLLKVDPVLLLETYVATVPDGKDPGDCSVEEVSEALESKQKAVTWFVEHADDEYSRKFYKEMKSEVVRPLFINAFNKKKCFTTQQSLEFLQRGAGSEKKQEADDYKKRLMAAAGLIPDDDVEPLKMDPEDAIRVLQLRFGLEV